MDQKTQPYEVRGGRRPIPDELLAVFLTERRELGCRHHSQPLGILLTAFAMLPKGDRSRAAQEVAVTDQHEGG